MTSTAIYEKLKAFRKSRLYDLISSTQLFAYESQNSGRVYLSVLGRNIPHIAVAIYPDEDALRSFYALFGQYPNIDDERIIYAAMSLIECGFSQKELMPKDVFREARAYLGRQAALYPGIIRHEFMRGERAADAQDQALAEEALDLVLWIAGRIQADSSFLNRFQDCDPAEETGIPVFSPAADGYSISEMILPAYTGSPYPIRPCPTSDMVNELAARKADSRHNLMVSYHIMNQKSDSSVPLRIVCSDLQLSRPAIAEPDETAADPFPSLLVSFCRFLLDTGKPKAILTDSFGTASMLDEFCRKAGIEIRFKELPKFRAKLMSL